MQSVQANAEAHPSSLPLRLTGTEQQMLESLACREKFDIDAEKIVARKRGTPGAGEFYAEVLCQPHSRYKNNLVHHIVFCDKDSGWWQCRRSEQAIRLAQGSNPLVYFENDIEVAVAYKIAQSLEAGKYYQGEEMPDAQQSICNIKRHAGHGNVEMDDVLVARCGIKEIFISTWCPQTDCPRIIGSRQ